MRTSIWVIACCLVVGSVGAMAAQKPKPKPKPKPPGLGSIGTTQMPGETCKFGTAYTLGKKDNNPINVCITGAEYVATRVKTGKTFVFPKVDTKLLVLHFTLHNPLPKAQWYQRWIKFTAVSPTSQNFETNDVYQESAPNDPMDTWLKPAQKIACYAIIEVPGTGEIEKLILENRASAGSLVARYPLTGIPKKMGPPYAEADGLTPLKVINAKMGETYQIDDSDVAVMNVEQVEGDGQVLEKRAPKETYVLVTYRVTCQNQEGGWMTNFEGGWLYNQLVDADGGTFGGENSNLRGSSVARFDPRSNFGEPATFRKAYVVERGVKLGYISLKTYHSRQIRWDLGGFTTK